MQPFVPSPDPAAHADQRARRRIQFVGSFEELMATPFAGDVNALCWRRTLPGDYDEIVERLAVEAGINTIDDTRLRALPLSAAGAIAREVILLDLELLRAEELSPVVDCIRGYHHELEAGPVPTHVQSWHVDSATGVADTCLCTYSGRSSEGLLNEEAMRRVDDPGTRAELLQLYGGGDDEGFHEFLQEHFYDLHYVPLPGARPYTFGVGNLWRVACEYPGSPVPPCIHRAPATVPGEPPRLLLIS